MCINLFVDDVIKCVADNLRAEERDQERRARHEVLNEISWTRRGELGMRY